MSYDSYDTTYARQFSEEQIKTLPDYAVIDDFSTFTGWSAGTACVFDGENALCIQVTRPGAVTFHKTFTSLPLGTQILFRFAVDAPAEISGVQIQFSKNNDSRNYWWYNVLSTVHDDTMTLVVVPVMDRWRNGAPPDWDEINTITLTCASKVPDGAFNLTVGKIETYTLPALLTNWFDDEFITEYTNGFSYMVTKSIVGAMAVVPNHIGLAGFMSNEQLLEMVAAGWEMTNHTIDHTLVTSEGAETKIAQGKTAIETLTGKPCPVMAYPGGAMNDAAEPIVAKYHIAGRTIVSDFLVQPYAFRGWNVYWSRVADPYFLPSLTPANITNMPVAAIKNAIDSAIQWNLWLIITWHEIRDTGLSFYYPIAAFQEVMDYIAEKRDAGLIEVVTPTQGLTRQRAWFTPTTIYANIESESSVEADFDAGVSEVDGIFNIRLGG